VQWELIGVAVGAPVPRHATMLVVTAVELLRPRYA